MAKKTRKLKAAQQKAAPLPQTDAAEPAGSTKPTVKSVTLRDMETKGDVLWLILFSWLFFFVVCLSAPATGKGTGMMLLVAAMAALVLNRKVLAERITLPFVVVVLYGAATGASAFYGVAPKLALREFLQILCAVCIALLLLAFAPEGRYKQPSRWIAGVLAGGAAAAGLVSIDLISTHILSSPVLFLLSLANASFAEIGGVEAGIRITSLFGNPNVFAGIMGIGVLLALSLTTSAMEKRSRRVYLCILFINSFAFVLAFSMGASAIIVVAFLALLGMERKNRGGLFVLMAETLLLTVVCAFFVSMTSFEAWDGVQPIPLLCAAAGGAALCLLDEKVGQPLIGKLEERRKLLGIFILGAILLVVAALGAALCWTGSAQMEKGDTLRRAAYPEPGVYTLETKGSEAVNVTVESQNRQETMMHTATILYEGALADAEFTVPEDSMVVYFNFSAQEKAVLDAVRYEGAADSGELALHYVILPGFIANRLQGLFANENAIQRLVFFEDGMKLVQRSPLIGLGLGSFESAVRSVQMFDYETKNVHNHYIQALLDTGMVGLAIFLLLLGSSAVAIVKNLRREDADPLIPALGAALVFMAGHAMVEVVFSFYAFLPWAFAVFALISLCSRQSMRLPGGEKIRVRVPAAILALLAVFAVFLGGNLMSASRVAMQDDFETLEQAIKRDRFEWADYMLAYIDKAATEEDVPPEILQQADEYVLELAQEESNTIPYYLAEYHFRRGDVDAGMERLMEYLDYVAADSDAWDAALRLMILHKNYCGEEEQWRQYALEVRDMLNEWNEQNIGKIELNPTSVKRLEKMCS